jgi:hypothetical protein
MIVSSSCLPQKWGINEFSEQPDRLNAVTGQYAAACRQVAASEGVPALDLWTGGPPILRRCPMHPTAVPSK